MEEKEIEKRSFEELINSIVDYRLNILDLGRRCLSENEMISPFDVEDVIIKKLENEMINNLSEKNRRIIYLRFGLEDGVCHTLEETAKLLKISRENVRVREKRILNYLRINLGLLLSKEKEKVL